MEDTAIKWATHTFNPWTGCTKVSPGCDNCYAERDRDKRFGKVKWGKGQPRVRASRAEWAKPLKWNEDAKNGEIIRVFCASLGDVFDTEVDEQWRQDLFALIRATPKLTWLLLTKRHNQAVRFYQQHGWPDNAWIGTSVENQEWADKRVKAIKEIPAPVRFLSIEPLLGPVTVDLDGIDWVIVGGESGPGHRTIQKVWVEALRDQCKAAKVSFFFKQWGGAHAESNGYRLGTKEHREFPKPKRRLPVVAKKD